MIYIASSLKNAARVQQLRDKLKAAGIDLSYDWTIHNYIDDDDPQKGIIAKKELEGIHSASCILVVLPGGHGTHFEFGYAYALYKPIILLINQEQESRSPSFYFLDNIFKTTDEQEALQRVMMHESHAFKPYTFK